MLPGAELELRTLPHSSSLESSRTAVSACVNLIFFLSLDPSDLLPSFAAFSESLHSDGLWRVHCVVILAPPIFFSVLVDGFPFLCRCRRGCHPRWFLVGFVLCGGWVRLSLALIAGILRLLCLSWISFLDLASFASRARILVSDSEGAFHVPLRVRILYLLAARVMS